MSLGKKNPNHQDDVYLELPRSQLRVRGIMSFLSLVTGAATLWALFLINESIEIGMPWLTLASTGLLLVGIFITASCFRIDTALPHDEPIRFTRSRHKVYADNYRCQWWNPFGKWKVVPVSYDWSQVRAERWWKHGGSIFQCGVMLSIV